MKTRFGFIDPGAIMGVVVSLIILAVGVFAFFVTLNEITNTANTPVIVNAVNNVSATGNSVFNIIGIVLIIGAIMSIVGLVYNYVR
jgi:beta-lactamase regulating signal transducer with metallopeptidase domain